MTSEILAALAALPVGFVTGVLSIRGVARWCRTCGATLDCLDCAQRTQRRTGFTRNAGRTS